MPLKKQLGLSMVETIVGFLLITLVILGVLNLFPGALLATRRSELALQAESVADQILESTRAQGFSNLNLGSYPSQNVVVNDYNFTTELKVARVAGKDARTLLSLQVRVSWMFRGQQHQLRREVWVSNVRS